MRHFASDFPRARPLIPYVVLAVSLLITLGATVYVSTAAAGKDQTRFDNGVSEIQSALRQRMDIYINLLRGGAGLFSSSASITRAQFAAYVDRLDLQENFRGIQGIGVSARVPPGGAEALVARMRREGDPTFTIHPPGPRDELHTILYLEPPNERNKAAIGYDMFTDPTRRAAMENARDTAAPAASGKVTLVQEIDNRPQAGFLIYVPIYYLREIPEDVALRRQALAGFIYSPFRADDLLDGMFGAGETAAGIEYDIYDGPRAEPAALLHRSDHRHPLDRSGSPQFTRTERLDVAARPWTIVYRSAPDFRITSARSWTFAVAGAGIATSILLFLLTAAQAAAQHRAEAGAQRLRESESRFRRLVDSNIVGVSFRNFDGRITDANDEFFRLLGYTRDEFRRDPAFRWQDITAPEDTEIDKRAVEQVRRTGVCPPFEKRLIRKDGSRVPVMVAIARLENVAGRDEDCVALNIDLTAQKNAERLLQIAKDNADAARADAEAANRLKDEFLATVSHELRTPLNAILGWAQLLHAGHASGEDLAQGLETIERNAKSQAQLVEDLLDVSRIVSGKLRLDVQPVMMAPIAEAAIESVRHAAEARGITIVTSLDFNAGPVAGDAGRLQQIAWNLLSNAVKFTPRGGSVQVSVGRVESHVELAVRDTGRGIDAEFLPHVFDRFRQADGGTTRSHGGLGLGLAIVRHLVELHGGTVRADSPGAGAGATFTVCLPLSVVRSRESAEGADQGELPDGAAPARARARALAGTRILIVEDDPDSRRLIERILTNAGARVTAAASAQQAVEQFQRERPDVLISDIGMPGEDGYTLLARLRALESTNGAARVPAVALTALARPEDSRRALLAGYQLHIAKPVEPGQLTDAVARVAAKPCAPAGAATPDHS
jgi:PAS domain S-box-containing protein